MSASNYSLQRITSYSTRYPKQLLIGIILVIALVAFEIFNFDTTQFALSNLLGGVAFAGLAWATILAIAFCGIDLAGLVRLFTPQSGDNEPKEVWFLMGAWLLGATMNAVMTWWAVSLTLLNNDFGNEVLSREQLLRYVPIFVAILVWLTRILFIGSISIAGEHLLGQRGSSGGGGKSRKRATPIRNKINSHRRKSGKRAAPQKAAAPRKPQNKPVYNNSQYSRANETYEPMYQAALPVDDPPPPPPAVRPSAQNGAPKRKPLNGRAKPRPNGRVRNRPPRPGIRPSSINANPHVNN